MFEGRMPWDLPTQLRTTVESLLEGEIRPAGVAVAVQTVSGKVANRPYIVGDLEAAAGDLLMCGRHLRYVSEKRVGSRVTDAQEQLCRRAETWCGGDGDQRGHPADREQGPRTA